MIEDLQTENDLPITAAAGWQEMHALLNKEMPVKKLTRRFLLLSLLPIAAMLILFLAVSIKLNRAYYIAKFYHQTPSNDLVVENNFSLKENAASTSTQRNKRNEKKTIAHTQRKRSKNKGAIISPGNIASIAGKEGSSHLIDHLIASPEKNKPGISHMTFINKITIPVTEKKISIKRWSIYAGAGVNVATAGNQYYQPYPVATIKYNINSHLFISSGLSLFSPAPGNVSAVSKIIEVNDMISNTKQYKEITNYTKLMYADLPVTLGLQLNKKLSIQAGLQSSLLLSKQTSIEKVSYDFQMNRIENSGVAITYAAPTLQQQLFNVKAPLMDYRATGAINYQIKKTLIGVQYQASLRKTIKPNNNIVSLSLSYQLK